MPLTVALDLAGIFVFALSGALAAVRKELDVVGVVVVGLVASLGGGLLRDVLLGDVVPPGLRDWRYTSVAVLASMVCFRFHPQVARLGRSVRLADAAGLGFFTVAGTAKALSLGLGPLPASLLGVVTGVGGGLLRDLLLREIPLVMINGEPYALLSLVGAIVVVLVDAAGWYNAGTAAAATGLVFVLRLLAVRHRWAAPTARSYGDL